MTEEEVVLMIRSHTIDLHPEEEEVGDQIITLLQETLTGELLLRHLQPKLNLVKEEALIGVLLQQRILRLLLPQTQLLLTKDGVKASLEQSRCMHFQTISRTFSKKDTEVADDQFFVETKEENAQNKDLESKGKSILSKIFESVTLIPWTSQMLIFSYILKHLELKHH